MSLTKPRDPLLSVARIILTALIAILACAAVVVLIAGPFVVYYGADILHGLPPGAPHWALGGILLVAVVILLAGGQFFRLLRRMIDSVAAGDPFIPENADRLAQMGWLLVGIELLSLPAQVLGDWLHRLVGDAEFGIAFSPDTILLALVLFILARVFREGARLRDEVEGTV